MTVSERIQILRIEEAQKRSGFTKQPFRNNLLYIIGEDTPNRPAAKQATYDMPWWQLKRR